MNTTKKPALRPVAGGVAAPKGFMASGVRAGIKSDKLDLALLFSQQEASVAGVFTTNRLAAAPVLLCQERVMAGKARAVVVNSGNANACTGEEGMQDARAMARRTAEALGLNNDAQILVASTGIIGHRLPMTKIHGAIPAAVVALTEDGGNAAAEAILTTDLVPKAAAVETETSGGTVRVGAMAKGSGMIRPRLTGPGASPPHATMLAFITTDALFSPGELQPMLEEATAASFNYITVDGQTSTNDSVILLANGASGVRPSSPSDKIAVEDAVHSVCLEMAHAIVKDGEGATKFVTVCVRGGKTKADAERAAFAIAESNLVKTALFGSDPNWGRIISAAGASGASLNPELVRISLNGVDVFDRGKPIGDGVKALAEGLQGSEAQIEMDLGAGEEQTIVWTSDLSYEYVRINAEYHT